MSTDETVSVWLEGVKEGNPDATQKLWERYFRRLVGLARTILKNTPRRAADEEDVALSAFKSFCIRAEQKKFPQLEDRHDLWKLLMTITVRKAFRLARKEGRQRPVEVAEFVEGQVTSKEPSPEFSAMVLDEFQRLLDRLGDETLQKIALAKMEGYKNREIAEQHGRHVTFVERTLQLIRSLWSDEMPV